MSGILWYMFFRNIEFAEAPHVPAFFPYKALVPIVLYLGILKSEGTLTLLAAAGLFVACIGLLVIMSAGIRSFINRKLDRNDG